MGSLVTKPQAVIAVATQDQLMQQQMQDVTKPQAVIAVATDKVFDMINVERSYKTASGNRCCNWEIMNHWSY